MTFADRLSETRTRKHGHLLAADEALSRVVTMGELIPVLLFAVTDTLLAIQATLDEVALQLGQRP